MHSIQTATGVSESKMTEVIFNACRANEKREPRKVEGSEAVVTFEARHTGIAVEHTANVHKGTRLLARAIVDASDI